MAITYTMTITSMTCYPTYASQTDVVFNVGWRYIGTDGTYIAYEYSTVNVTYEAGSPFTPYNQLTQDQVVGWVESAIGPAGMAQIQTNIAASIANQINPPITQPPLPWSA